MEKTGFLQGSSGYINLLYTAINSYQSLLKVPFFPVAPGI